MRKRLQGAEDADRQRDPSSHTYCFIRNEIRVQSTLVVSK